MKPKLFDVSDLLLIWIPIAIILLISGAIAWNLISSHGEPIKWQGYFISGLVIVTCIGIIIRFYLDRYNFISMWKYTTSNGVACYYEPNTKIYLKLEVETEITRVLNKWSVAGKLTIVTGVNWVGGIVCIFKPASDFITHGWWRRRVCGIAYDSTIAVAQGGRSIENTSFSHELSHIILSRISLRVVPENEAHSIFTEVGI